LLLTGPDALDAAALQKVATPESARGAVHRLFAAAEERAKS
jgi:hypothetical protein